MHGDACFALSRASFLNSVNVLFGFPGISIASTAKGNPYFSFDSFEFVRDFHSQLSKQPAGIVINLHKYLYICDRCLSPLSLRPLLSFEYFQSRAPPVFPRETRVEWGRERGGGLHSIFNLSLRATLNHAELRNWTTAKGETCRPIESVESTCSTARTFLATLTLSYAPNGKTMGEPVNRARARECGMEAADKTA